ncbi:MAG: ABC transporter permease, partial [Actinomycetota bacterium]|nr:ABC transporter permease [Actinomycetota bacterium]
GPSPEQSAHQGTRRYVASRVMGALGSMAFVLVFNFFLFRVLPGDPVETLARNRLLSEESQVELREVLGLDESLWQQFLTYLGNTFTGEFGISYTYRLPVSELILDRLWPTVVLVGSSSVLAMVIGLRIGIRAAWERDGRFDRVSTGSTLTLYSMPEWWLGLLLLATLAVGIGPFPGIFPVGNLISPGVDATSIEGVFDQAWHLALPIVTLTLAYLADFSLIMRSSLIDELGEDYLNTARAKGLRDAMVRRRHAVPNALLPATTLIALTLGFVVSGAITIETVYSIPGLGLLTYDALSVPDYPLLQGTFLFFSAAVVVANLAASLLYGVLDPRVRG